MSDKASIREQIIALRDATAPERRRAWSRGICECATQLPQYIAAKCIHCFLSMRSEIDTQYLIQHALLNGKQVAIPHFVRNREETPSLQISTLNEDAFAVSGFGLRVPRIKQRIEPEEIDLVFVPLLAFKQNSILRRIEDQARTSIIDEVNKHPNATAIERASKMIFHRVGYGAGYYDRFLTCIRPGVGRVGLAFGLQQVHDFEVEAHDVPLDLVISEVCVNEGHPF